MKIFSNFDTNLKTRSYKRYCEQYGSNNVVLLTKSNLFWLIHFFLPFIVFCGIVALISYLMYFFVGERRFMLIGLPITLVLLLLVFVSLLGILIEYKMDFTIVTPKLIITYDQQGVFQRYIKTIHVQNIKTISVVRSGFLYSIFNNGDILFLSEGDLLGEVLLHYIYKPEKKRHAIAIVLGRG